MTKRIRIGSTLAVAAAAAIGLVASVAGPIYSAIGGENLVTIAGRIMH